MRPDISKFIQASAKRALSDTITSHVLGVTISYDEKLMVFRAYFEPEALDDDKELLDVALAEMAADLWQEIAFFEYQPVTVNAGEQIGALGEWLYLRDKTT